MIDNFELIKPLFYFNEDNDIFFHCQLLKRAKDFPGKKVDSRIIKTYFIRSREHLDKLRGEIITLCEYFGARAYINVAGKDFSKLQSLMLVKLASEIHQGIVRNPLHCLNSAAGELKSRSPRWVVDIDDITQKSDIINAIINLYVKAYHTKRDVMDDNELKEFAYNCIYDIPTKNGAHLITKPFDIKEFSKLFPNIDIHKNSMGTILYIPECIS